MRYDFYVVADVIPYNSPSLTDGAATTNRLTGGSGSFVAGKVSEDGLVDDLGWSANNYTEVVYSLTLRQAGLSNGDTLRFRILENGSTALLTYSQTPTVTITKGAPVANPPVTSFSASASAVTAGQTVTFTDTSTGGAATAWTWDFGVGASPATASTKGPHTVTYSTVGTSTVTYSSSNADGSSNAPSQTVTVSAVVLTTTGRPKVWTGAAWVNKPGKYWNGTAWVEKPWKVWTGSTWKLLGAVPTGTVQHSVFGASAPAATYTSYNDAGYEGWVATQFYITASPARNWRVVGTRLYLHAGSSLIGRSGAIGAKRRAQADGGIFSTENPLNDLDTNIMYTPFSTPLVAGWNDRMFVTTLPMNSLDGVIIGWWLQGYYVYSNDLYPGGLQAADGVNLYLAETSGGAAHRSYYAPSNAADLGETPANHYGIDILTDEGP